MLTYADVCWVRDAGALSLYIERELYKLLSPLLLTYADIC
jgi:hypothetical protein